MAGLGSGSYRFSNSVDNNKSYIYVKLTESAHKTLEEYLKYKNCNKSLPCPSISFRGSDGEINFPNDNHGGSAFKFQMQKAQDAEGPQGSFESIRQSNPYSLDSLGPLLHIMRIQAKDDSYEKTRQSMANAMAQNGKTCVKELKQNVLMNRHRPTRPSSMVVPPHKKEPSNFSSNPYSSHNGNTTSSSPHRSSSGKQQPWNAPPQKHSQMSKKLNEALKKRPLRERIIHLLALKPMNKLMLLQRIRSEGVREHDNRHISSVLQSVATVKNNAYHLPKHLWSEVNENWSFYTEEEKALVQRNRPQNSSPNEANNSAPLSPCSLGSGGSDPLKRPQDTPPYDTPAKKARTTLDTRVPDLTSRSERDFSGSSGGIFVDESPRGDSGLRDSRRGHWSTKRDDTRIESSHGDSGSINGHSSPSATSVSPLSQNNSPRNSSYSCRSNDNTSAILSNGCGNRGDNYRNTSRNNHSDTNHSNDNYTSDHNHIQSSSPTSSPDSQQENKDLTLNYREQYSKIENNDQRRQYKVDFNRIYKEYQILHADLEKTKIFFKELEATLNEKVYGSLEYHMIKQRMCDEYHSRQTNFLEKKQRYNHLDEVLKHIKQHVSDYDALHQQKLC